MNNPLIRSYCPSEQTDSFFTFPLYTRRSIHYESFLEHTNNEAFDSSWDRGQELAFIFGKGQLIEGLEIAVSEMSVGQRVEARIPHHLAYGVKGYPPVIPPRATLVYRVELMSVSP